LHLSLYISEYSILNPLKKFIRALAALAGSRLQ